MPTPWRQPLEVKGITSKRGLAARAGISPATASRLIDGVGTPSVETVAAVADSVFDGDRDRVWALAGFDRRDSGDWTLPPEASLLDQEQRAAVLAVVRAMLPPDQRTGDGDVDRDATPMTPAQLHQWASADRPTPTEPAPPAARKAGKAKQ